MFAIFFDPSPMLIVNQSFLSWVPIVEDQMDDIRKYGISCLKPNWTAAWCWHRKISNFDLIALPSLPLKLTNILYVGRGCESLNED